MERLREEDPGLRQRRRWGALPCLRDGTRRVLRRGGGPARAHFDHFGAGVYRDHLFGALARSSAKAPSPAPRSAMTMGGMRRRSASAMLFQDLPGRILAETTGYGVEKAAHLSCRLRRTRRMEA